jgi:hypothetical protein
MLSYFGVEKVLFNKSVGDLEVVKKLFESVGIKKIPFLKKVFRELSRCSPDPSNTSNNLTEFYTFFDHTKLSACVPSMID